MDDKKIRKISKRELLEILLEQAKKIEELEKELEKTTKKLETKKMIIEEAGTFADASAKLNGLFETAEVTANQYLLNVKEKCKKIENDTKKECQKIKEDMIKETEELCNLKKKEADDYFDRKKRELAKNRKTLTKKTIKLDDIKQDTNNKPKKKQVKKITTKKKGK